ncbi:MAG: 50S ribosomal protein L18 [Caldisericia bacterium]|nr:50S ribosomal protein L18 [Caldisericia bacterium]
MFEQYNRNAERLRRKAAIRRKVAGTPQRPRLTVFRSLKHISVQVIDDTTGNTLLSVHSGSKEMGLKGKNIEVCKKVGQTAAKKAIEMGINEVVFDRSGYLYHGRIKALADAAREAGLKF